MRDGYALRGEVLICNGVAPRSGSWTGIAKAKLIKVTNSTAAAKHSRKARSTAKAVWGTERLGKCKVWNAQQRDGVARPRSAKRGKGIVQRVPAPLRLRTERRNSAQQRQGGATPSPARAKRSAVTHRSAKAMYSPARIRSAMLRHGDAGFATTRDGRARVEMPCVATARQGYSRQWTAKAERF